MRVRGNLLRTLKKLVGDRLKAAREAAGLSQDDVAQKLDVDQSRVSRWETGKNLPTGERRKRLIKLLRVSQDDIFGAGDMATTPQMIDGDALAGLELLRKFADAPRDLQILVLAFVDQRPDLIRLLSPEFRAQLSRLLLVRV